jgi:hypothetical protein
MSQMDKWEYKVEQDCDEATLNSLGSQGGELVSVIYREYTPAPGDRRGTVLDKVWGTVFYFKHRKP